MRSFHFLALIAVASSATALKYTEVSFTDAECTATCKAFPNGESVDKLQKNCFDTLKEEEKAHCKSATVTLIPDKPLPTTECAAAPEGRRLEAIEPAAESTPRVSVDLTSFIDEISKVKNVKADTLELAKLEIAYKPVKGKCDSATLHLVKEADACTAKEGTKSAGTPKDDTLTFDTLTDSLTDEKALTVVVKPSGEDPCTIKKTDEGAATIAVTAQIPLDSEVDPTPPAPAPGGMTVVDPKVAFGDKDCKAPKDCETITSTDDVEKCLAAAAKDDKCKTATYERSYSGLVLTDCAKEEKKLRRLASIPKTSHGSPKFALDLKDVLEDEGKVTTGSAAASITDFATGKTGDEKCKSATLFSVTEAAEKACEADKGESIKLESKAMTPIDFTGEAAALDEKAKALVVSLESEGEPHCTITAAEKAEVSLKMTTKYDLHASPNITTTTVAPSGALNQIAAAGLVTLVAVTLF